MAKDKKKGLGRGLSALMGDDVTTPTTQATADTIEKPDNFVPIDLITPNPDQPRRTFDEATLNELADSIRKHGLIQPVLVRPDPNKNGAYQIVAGERRWRASQKAQLHEIPVVVRELDDAQTLEIAIIENVQRSDLNPVEESMGYAQLIDKFGHTQDAVAQIVGKSRPYIANSLRLLNLPKDVLDSLANGEITSGHARALVGHKDASGLMRQIIQKGLSVRDIEGLIKKDQENPQSKNPTVSKKIGSKDSDTIILEDDLSAALGQKVKINHKSTGDGELTIKYDSLEKLDELCRKLSDIR